MYRERTMGVNAVNLIFIKRFQFPEPVFNEKNLVKDIWSRETDFRFLANQDKMNRKIDHFDDALVEIKNGCLLKPIKNLYIPQDNFWRPFRQDYEQLRLARRRKLSFYPFQVICNDEIGLNESKLEELIKTKIRDYKINVQARIFPPGAGTIHFALYLKLDGFDLDSINPLLDLKNILIYYRKKEVLFNIMWVNSETTPICQSLDKSSYFYILQS